MERFLTTETPVTEPLLIVSLVAIAVRRVRVPDTIALVVVGLLLTFRQPLQTELTSELILALFVTPLVLEAITLQVPTTKSDTAGKFVETLFLLRRIPDLRDETELHITPLPHREGYLHQRYVRVSAVRCDL